MVARREDGIWVNASDQRAVIVVGEDGSAIGGGLRAVSTTLTRPSNTTAYDAGDAVADATSGATYLTFADVVSADGGSGRIVGARVVTNKKDVVPRFRLHLFHTAPSGQSQDNGQFRFLDADKASEVGYLDFPAMLNGTDATNSTSAKSQNTDLYLPFVCAAADTDLYGLLETLDIFTPASAQTFYIEFLCEG